MAGRAPTAAEISTVLSRGYKQEDIDRFNLSNPGDGGRILSAFPTQGGSSGGGGGGATYTPSTRTIQPTGPATTTSGLGGLQTAAGIGPAPSGGSLGNVPIGGTPPTTDPNAGAAPVNYGSAGGGGGSSSINFAMGGPAQLRDGLGRRTPPAESAALAGLRRAY